MAIALVAHVSGNNAGTSVFTTAGINTTGATLLVANVTRFNAARTCQLTDSLNNTWVPLPIQFQTDAAGVLFYCSNPVVGAGHTFTCTDTNFSSLQVAAFSGVSELAALDVSAGNKGTSASATGGTVTPTNANSLVISACTARNTGNINSVGSGFTITDSVNTGSVIDGAIAYLIETSIVAANPAWTLSGSINWGVTNAVFIAGSSTLPTSPALVASVNVEGDGTFTSAAIDTTGATLLVVNQSAFTTPGTLSDSKGNTWTAFTQRSNGTTIEVLYYAVNPTVGSGHTFTLTTGNHGSLQAAAFSGVDSVSPFDVSAGTTGTGDGQPGSVTPSGANALLVSGLGYVNNVQEVVGIDSDFKIIKLDPATAAPVSTIGGALAYLVETTLLAKNPKWYFSGGAITWGGQNAVFKKAIPGQTIQVPVGSIAITTYAPTVKIGVPVPVAALAFTTYAPTLASVIPVPVPVGTLVLTTYAPVVAISIPVPATSLGLTTYPPFIGIISINVPTAVMAITSYAPTVTEPVTVPVPKGLLVLTTYAPHVFAGDLTPCAERFGPKLYYWEPSYLDRPEDTFLRATDWENGGHQGLKFVQGLIIEADTEGQNRQILLQGDQLDIETITINHAGQVMKPYSLNQPVQKHLLRLWPVDIHPWRLFNVRWVFEPAPEFAKEWKTQGTDHDLPGYQFLKDGYIAHSSTANITLNITVDDNVFSYVIPHSSGQYIKTYILFARASSGLSLKGKLFTYELTSTAAFQLFQKDCEVRVHAWAGGDYLVKLPFGGEHRKAGARI